MPDTSEVRYFVLADRAVPYLLAKVRWPDIAQAISGASPDWLDDPGLFDLPYEPTAVTVSFPQAAAVAAAWGKRLHAEPDEDVPSYIRRMPANWSDLSPSERRIWGIEFMGGRRARARRIRRARPPRGNIAHSSDLAQAKGHLAEATSGPVGVAIERRAHARVPVDGRAYIRCEHTTVTAGLADLSERGVRCVLPDDPPLVASGATLGGPFLLEAEPDASWICLGVVGRISWLRITEAGTHFGVAFAELANGETEGLQRFLAAASRKRGRR
ncbi:MAG TPA: PilZ domain-containing protein [Solirubrobacteraceae bacterium]|nr:PilZ domain-containing protein [Solirubrobacteraceae bacterium]